MREKYAATYTIDALQRALEFALELALELRCSVHWNRAVTCMGIALQYILNRDMRCNVDYAWGHAPCHVY